LASKYNNFDDLDKEMAFAIWFAEKEFHVGPITDEYPLMKLFALYEPSSLKKYEKICKTGTPGSGMPKTFR
jgi:hypothetical protein